MDKFGILGTGNVAWHLINEFTKINVLDFVAGRNINELNQLQKKFKIDSYSINSIPNNSFVIVAIKDRFIDDVCQQLLKKKCFVAHTSGSTGIQFSNSNKLGVFYPLQTMTKEISINFHKVPILVESNDKKFEDILYNLGKKISSNVAKSNSETRMKIHLSAVFANNFVNHILSISEKILLQNGIERTFLHGLIKETIRKVIIENPKKTQTGPAKRGDDKTILNHINNLSGYDKEIYKTITKSIQSERK